MIEILELGFNSLPEASSPKVKMSRRGRLVEQYIFMLDKNILQKNIISELNLEMLDDEKKVALLDKMSEVIQKRLTLRVLEKLSDSDQDEFEKIMDKEPDKVSDFLQTKIPEFTEIIQEEIVKLKSEMIEKFGKV